MATKGASATWLGGGPEGWLGKPPPNCSSMRTYETLSAPVVGWKPAVD
jgi:hypothetical protein